METTQTSQSLYQALWNSADVLRSKMDANDYIELLSQHGTRAGQPYIKHLDAEIWELRPLRDRILFVA